MNAPGRPIHDAGARDKLPVVFLHAFPLHSGQWDAQREALRSRARVVSLDARGFGTSPPSATGYLLEHLVDDLFAALDALSIRSALLCGLSMGGYVALRAVERDPARVRGLVLADTQAAADSNEAKLGRAEALRKLWREGRESFAEANLKRALSPHTFERAPEVVERAKAMVLEASDEAIAAALAALATRTDLSESLSRIAVPTRVIVGSDDVITPPKVARALAAQIPGADVHELEHAGHLSNLEAPEAFNRLLIEQLERVAARPEP